MYPLELWLLKRFCDRYEFDYQEIDETLSYYENREHLESMFIDLQMRGKPRFGPIKPDRSGLTEWEYRESEWAAQMAEYLSEHTLENYIAHVEAGWTISEEVGEPYDGPGLFSLYLFIQRLG